MGLRFSSSNSDTVQAAFTAVCLALGTMNFYGPNVTDIICFSPLDGEIALETISDAGGVFLGYFDI